MRTASSCPVITFKCTKKTSIGGAIRRAEGCSLGAQGKHLKKRDANLGTCSSGLIQLINIGLLLHSIIGYKCLHPTIYVNHSNLVRPVTCSIEDLPRPERGEVELAMGLNEKTKIRKKE